MSSTAPRSSILVLCGAIAALVGCSDDAGSACPSPCPTGTICNAASASCVASGPPQCTVASYPSRLCAQGCVDVSADPNNCGTCGKSCGGQPCVAGQCGQPSSSACAPTAADACGSASLFCSEATNLCQQCPGGNAAFNCDGTGGCECELGCDGSQCKSPSDTPYTPSGLCSYLIAGACGNDTTQYCEATGHACTACSGVLLNCDLTGACECNGATNECNGTQCVPRSGGVKPSTCDEKHSWDGHQCNACPQFDYDCNQSATDGCECTFANAAIGCYWDGTCDYGMD